MIQCVVGTKYDTTPNATAAITTNTSNNRYSAAKNARAPSLIDLEILCIFSSPAGCFFTQDILTNIKSNPTIANAIGT